MKREEREEFEQDSEIVSIKPHGVEYGQKAHDTAYNKVMDSIGLIQQDRENDYGDAKVSHQSIAVFWNEYLNRKVGNSDLSLDDTDVAVMLSLMKVSRLAYKRKHDSFLDFASYADFALKFQEGN